MFAYSLWVPEWENRSNYSVPPLCHLCLLLCLRKQAMPISPFHSSISTFLQFEFLSGLQQSLSQTSTFLHSKRTISEGLTFRRVCSEEPNLKLKVHWLGKLGRTSAFGGASPVSNALGRPPAECGCSGTCPWCGGGGIRKENQLLRIPPSRKADDPCGLAFHFRPASKESCSFCEARVAFVFGKCSPKSRGNY